MDIESAAEQLEALGNSTRLAIFIELVRAGEEGVQVGEIREKLDIPASTLSHHITKLVHSGLMTQQRLGRSLVCRAAFKAMDSLIMFLANNCCAEDSEIWG
jgi:DNA-binding transcriptional ArsR family regulator